ncbi:MAG TPA: hypothetical protein VHL34_19160 [Rhizomicrobium sp.]|nr:hypothetical protein [Rhizomicrobium sp.]
MRKILLGLALTAIVLPASAQQNPNDRTSRYAVQEMNFDLWCQQNEGLPPERCDKRLPEDNEKFEAYRALVEKYEIPYLQSKNRAQNLNRVVIHADPVPNEDAVNHPTNHEIASPRPNP